MKRWICQVMVAASALSLFDGSEAQAASFDCRKATADVEHMICDTPSLSLLDEQLAAAFNPLKNQRSLQSIQSDWLASVRDECETVECLEDAYTRQVRFLTPVPEKSSVNPKSLQPLPAGQGYVQREHPWPRWTLSGMPQGDLGRQRYIVAATRRSGIMHVILFSGDFDKSLFCYRGNLYEYVDKFPGPRPTLHTIAENICLDGADDIGGNDEGKHYAGLIDGMLYYRQQMSTYEFKGMSYALGSNAAPRESSLLHRSLSRSLENAKAVLLFSADNGYGQLGMYYSHVGKSEDIAPGNGPQTRWLIYNPTWNPSRPVVYFINSLSFIWRADLVDKTLSKIIEVDDKTQVHSPTPMEVNGREGVIYLEDDQLMMAIAPDD
ncbi:hypothetical protein ASF84_26430 [Pseudomonas sp. Leaf127]|uniref:lysozyme inhibitor LprI family protein n=1 Tax=Pseudomonas sp. Leaf127 TaxID=1736267 RepID=UPI0007036DEA|nr:hypothetical protein [Pseudomonas sp. Leaf127]KQQ62571.1 hypothetical protein ASF84_26430 [Pseudomonas sp. Leaf127]